MKDGFLDINNFYDNNKDFVKSLGFGWFTFLVKNEYIVRSCNMVEADNIFVAPLSSYRGNKRKKIEFNVAPIRALKKVCSFLPNIDKLREGIDYIKEGDNYFYNRDWLLEILKKEYERRRL